MLFFVMHLILSNFTQFQGLLDMYAYYSHLIDVTIIMFVNVLLFIKSLCESRETDFVIVVSKMHNLDVHCCFMVLLDAMQMYNDRSITSTPSVATVDV